MEGSKAFFKQATVAQLVEQLIRNQQVRGSSPLSSFFDGGKLSKIVEAWLSLVERCVRDAEVASSNLVASMIPAYWSSGQDAALSRRKPGFDSRIGHIIVRERHCLVRTVPFLRLEIKLKTVDQMLTEISFVSLILLCQIRLVV